MAEQPGADARAGREQQAEPIQRTGQDAQPRLHPARAAGHVLQDEGNRHREAGDEAAAGQVVAAQEQEDGERRRSPGTADA